MKKTFFSRNSLLPLCFVAVAGILFISWNGKQQHTYKQASTDTLPLKERKITDLDAAIAELDKVNIQLEIEKAMKDVNIALKELDAAKINKEIQAAMKEIDLSKLKTEIAQAMKEVDVARLQTDLASLANIDWEKIQAEVKKVEQVDFTALEKELAGVREEMQQLQPKLEKEMLKAQEEIAKAKETLKEYKTFVDGLEKDGLINKKEGYSIEHKDGKLIINGEEVSPKIYKKNEPFLKKHKNININQSSNKEDKIII